MQKEVWEKIALKWNEYRKWPAQIVKELANIWKKGKILDIGCGNGRNLKPFVEKGFNCYGIDFSEKMITIAKKEVKKSKFKVANSEKLPFKANSFDYCLFLRTLPTIKSKENRLKAIKELRRVLKKNGKVLISVWNKKTSEKEVLIPWPVGKRIYHRYYYMYSSREIKDLLKKNGFKILRIDNRIKKDYILEVEKV